MLKTLHRVVIPHQSILSFSRRKFANEKLYVTLSEVGLCEYLKSKGAFLNGAQIAWKRRTKNQNPDPKEEVEIVQTEMDDMSYLSERMRRGFFVSKPITQGETIVSIPYDLTINIETKTTDMIGNGIALPFPSKQEVLEEGMTREIEDRIFEGLVLYVTSQKSTTFLPKVRRYQSVFTPWVFLLPEYFVNGHVIAETPSLYKETEKTELRELSNFLQTKFEKSIIHNLTAYHRGTSYYRWSWCCVLSRSFMQGSNFALIPLVDYINHPDVGKQANVDIRFGEDGSVTMKALCDLKKGDELFYSYGDFTNQELLSYYGFTLDDNYFYFTFKYPISSSISPKKREYLKRLNFSILKPTEKEEYIKIVLKTTNWKKVIHEELLPLMRTIFFDEEIIKQSLGKKEPVQRTDVSIPLSNEFEYQVIVLALHLLKQKEYPWSIEEDEKYLESIDFTDPKVFSKQPQKVNEGYPVPIQAVKADIVKCRLGEMKLYREIEKYLQTYQAQLL